jgi:hypothetical protein
VYSDLEKCIHMFLHQDTMRWVLEPPRVATTGPCHGERRHCDSSCVGGLSPC